MTRNKFNEELKQLLNSVRVMGVNLEDTLDKVIANLEQKDAALAQQIISDDDNFDNSEVNIEKQCLELVLTQTPVATDWREIASCLKLVGDMERIADHCSNIAVAMIEVAADKFDTHEYLNNVKHGGSVKFERRYEKYRGRYTFPPEAYSEPAENPAEN